MPEGITSLPEVRCSALEEFVRKGAAPESSKTQNCHGRRTKTRGRGARTSPTQSVTANDEPPSQPPSRKRGSSIYYGVRFRPDLNKWVAEIRVAEWKDVDKKVWLGTFGTERGAARGVDLARKLLKCKKKHSYNLPCVTLDSYSGQIPSHLVLTDVATNSMFKAATLFIKRESQEYAAGFDDDDDDDDDSQNFPKSDLTAKATSPDQFQAPTQGISHMVSQTNAVNAEIHELVNEYCDTESQLLQEYVCELESMISTTDCLNDCLSFDQVAVWQSSSNTSATSCVTFDQPCLDVTECEMSSAAPDAGFGDGGSVMAPTMVPGAVSQEYWVDQDCTWPGPGSSSALAPLPGSCYTGMTSFMSYVDGNYNPSIDCDDLLYQGVHCPFQHGSNGWF